MIIRVGLPIDAKTRKAIARAVGLIEDVRTSLEEAMIDQDHSGDPFEDAIEALGTIATDLKQAFRPVTLYDVGPVEERHRPTT